MTKQRRPRFTAPPAPAVELVHARVTLEERAAIDRVAAAIGMSTSAFVRDAVTALIDVLEKQGHDEAAR